MGLVVAGAMQGVKSKVAGKMLYSLTSHVSTNPAV